MHREVTHIVQENANREHEMRERIVRVSYMDEQVGRVVCKDILDAFDVIVRCRQSVYNKHFHKRQIDFYTTDERMVGRMGIINNWIRKQECNG